MCYCEKCKKEFRRPNLGPRKVLESGLFKPTVYDLEVCYSYLEYETYVKAYYYKRNLYCPKCGRFYEKMDDYWAEEFGEKASTNVIRRYFEYCRDHGMINDIWFQNHNYPGNSV